MIYGACRCSRYFAPLDPVNAHNSGLTEYTEPTVAATGVSLIASFCKNLFQSVFPVVILTGLEATHSNNIKNFHKFPKSSSFSPVCAMIATTPQNLSNS